MQRPSDGDHLDQDIDLIIGLGQRSMRKSYHDELLDQLQVTEARERVLRCIFDSSNQFTGLLKPDGTLVAVNQTALSFVNSSLETLRGIPFWDTPWWKGSGSEDQLREIIRLASHGHSSHERLINVGADGRRVTVAFSAKPVCDRYGQVEAIVAEGLDVTVHIEMERILRQRNDDLVTAERLGGVGTVVFQLTGEIWMSAGFCHLHGLDPASGAIARFHDFLHAIHADDRPRVAATRQDNGLWLLPKGLQYRVNGTAPRMIEVQDSVVVDRSATTGHALFSQTTFIDITERKQVLDRMISQEREAVVGRMAGRVAHEVNNPLEAIKALVDPLRRRCRDMPEVGEGLEVINRQVDRIARLVQALMGLERQRTVNRKTVRPSEIIATVIDLFQPRFTKAGKTLRLHLPPDTSSVVVIDADQIQQVVINLLENALDAIPTGGLVDVTLQHERPWLMIAVEDDGPGLGDDPDHFFQPFYTTKSNGSGLGLSVSRTICQAHQGDITGENRQPHGACFRVRLRDDLSTANVSQGEIDIATGEIQV